jgi:serine/threonine protein phosphatase PrpC
MVIIQKPLDGFYFFGVFDSHGSSGREVSETLSNFF